MADIPGSVAKHRFISDNCVRLKGQAPAIEEALEDARAFLLDALSKWRGKGAKFHVVVTVERPSPQEGDDE